ncbi:hypothetical protein BXZ70DRAFT_1008745 [Cristinia sonorae]|uniref:Uncharacterized protein n=1 Tax=Cristinia sonorae TaxID=1940300 RepID=A0A8K0UN10_9AGAR|nr:hypothetical protein BXZ70DRAFT_1008745 [Cristinia sonorae]
MLSQFGCAKHAAIEDSITVNKKNRVRKEMSAYYCGPIPAQGFMEEFLPPNADFLTTINRARFTSHLSTRSTRMV